MKVVHMRAEHLLELSLQPAQAHAQPFVNETMARNLEQLEHSYAVLIDERPIAVGGVHEIWPGRWHAWAFIDQAARRHWIGIHKAVQRFFRDFQAPRVELAVVSGFVEGDRWAQMLGFTREGVARKYFPDGRDYTIYARVTDG